MQIRVIDQSGDVIWSRSETCGMTSLSYRKDGTLLRIIGILYLALHQAQAELLNEPDFTDAAVSNSEALETMLNR